MLQLNHLSKHYGKSVVFDDLNFKIGKSGLIYTISLCFMSAYLIDALLFKYYLRQLTYFSGIRFMFQWTVVLSTVLLILFIAFICVGWNIRGVKLNKLNLSLSKH
ncbi:hypothetical protein I4Q36_03860 [Tuanshanicoccus lijuaniae]|uniref:hypothetical protein n=1 Tax=Aerococcaceae bacterium zg-1292 TaxID=2774330 RepID=UPI0019351F93|nr:hypothetical protein [Aerococcaceae bacterium zg-1292]MBF6625873.1 hypothetical protein [Aerococcaceae bacterium zg-BR9]MBF6978571.1 hypothetical protein [Aerococcaceae bacterium zg-BR22]MBS4455551.1 hypothetical protein [Aerococcaceae bacterium zg-A91]MBS4457170.1 hypothetical protein [Aerococcaceae bacterium zg-BR33]